MTTKHNDAGCYAQGAPRSQTSSTHTAAVVGAQARPDDIKNKPVVNFDDKISEGFTFQVVKIQQGRPAIIGVALSTRGRQENVSRDRCNSIVGSQKCFSELNITFGVDGYLHFRVAGTPLLSYLDINI